MKKSVAVIAGAGPAGLTAAYELQKRTDIHPLVFEATDAIGGIENSQLQRQSHGHWGAPFFHQS